MDIKKNTEALNNEIKHDIEFSLLETKAKAKKEALKVYFFYFILSSFVSFILFHSTKSLDLNNNLAFNFLEHYTPFFWVYFCSFSIVFYPLIQEDFISHFKKNKNTSNFPLFSYVFGTFLIVSFTSMICFCVFFHVLKIFQISYGFDMQNALIIYAPTFGIFIFSFFILFNLFQLNKSKNNFLKANILVEKTERDSIEKIDSVEIIIEMLLFARKKEYKEAESFLFSRQTEILEKSGCNSIEEYFINKNKDSINIEIHNI